MNTENIEMVDFSSMEGYQKALDSLDFLPEEMRDELVSGLISLALFY